MVTQDQKIHVKIIDGKWGVELRHAGIQGLEQTSIKMQSKEDAVRYARVCEQRTGCKVLLPETNR